MKSTCKISKNFKLFLLTFALFTFWGCKTTQSLSRKNFTPDAPFKIEQNLAFQNISEPYKYIFLRLYNPVYKNPFQSANTLKNLIKITEISDYSLSHSSIGFSLEDSFYGLTATGNRELKLEKCTQIQNNPYMKKCNPQKSDQLTLAIKVRETEYSQIKEYVEECIENPNIQYDPKINVDIGLISIKRKFFAKKKNKVFGTVIYPKEKTTLQNNKFVCSSFIAHCLVKFVPEIREWFINHNQNENLVTVTDLLYLPNCIKLFYSSWDDYELAATAFVAQYPEFSTYL